MAPASSLRSRATSTGPEGDQRRRDLHSEQAASTTSTRADPLGLAPPLSPLPCRSSPRPVQSQQLVTKVAAIRPSAKEVQMVGLKEVVEEGSLLGVCRYEGEEKILAEGFGKEEHQALSVFRSSILMAEN